jgi:SAM-dependent methyltransferase
MTTRGCARFVAVFALLAVTLAASPAQDRSPGSSKPARDSAGDCRSYRSACLGGTLVVGAGVLWPEPAEKLVMPLMAARKDAFQGKTVLDLETGSGILALYAARLGAAKVVATDLEPAAVACARENARKLGLDSVVETRQGNPGDPSAYAVLRPGEVFDIIVFSPSGSTNRRPVARSGAVDAGIQPDDSIRFGFSVLRELERHLARDGVLVLNCRFALVHTLLTSFARHMGYTVEAHPPLQLSAADWFAMVNTFNAEVARTERLAPELLLLAPSPDRPNGREPPETTGAYHRVNFQTDQGLAYSRLWDTDLDRVLNGVMVIRIPGKPTGQTGP